MVAVSGEGHDTAREERDLLERAGALWRALKNEPMSQAREKLFACYSGFAESVARQIWREVSRSGIEFGDLKQYAYTGLLEAIDRFDPGLGTPFRAFAVHRISGSVRDGLVHMNEAGEQVSWRRRMRRERLKSLSEGRSGELAPVEKLAELAVGLALGFMLEDSGLIAAAESDTSPVNAYDSLAWKETLDRLHREMETLGEREATILREHYINGMDFECLAALLSLSKGRISQLHREALATLRKRLRGHNHFRMIR